MNEALRIELDKLDNQKSIIIKSVDKMNYTENYQLEKITELKSQIIEKSKQAINDKIVLEILQAANEKAERQQALIDLVIEKYDYAIENLKIISKQRQAEIEKLKALPQISKSTRQHVLKKQDNNEQVSRELFLKDLKSCEQVFVSFKTARNLDLEINKEQNECFIEYFEYESDKEDGAFIVEYSIRRWSHNNEKWGHITHIEDVRKGNSLFFKATEKKDTRF